eukprot:CAMPEP_0201592870 /NCGR_PEP_ID=MMETSP0190_2-20130828/190639_1 /ASSEMBLY_ACC=CAM_ASM_000263 /TAXON_ID=37353 /ORGANISM="Rosalina sp." /LENGTH=300 /DNA_ID=CAMNT_0048051819 /DNA_START=571 /DNA_END=1473 /DNA_ORIENTATION=-
MGPLVNAEERTALFEIFKVYSDGFKPKSQFEDADDPESDIGKAFIAKDKLNGILRKKFIEAEELIKNDKWTDKYGDEQCVLRGLMENDDVFDNDGEYGLYDKVDHIISMIWAAYETSSVSLNNLVYAMHKYPEETENVRTSIMNDPELSNPETVFSMDMLNGCNELGNFINESQRIYGFNTLLTRNVSNEKGLDFGGFLFPKETEWLHFGGGSWTESTEFTPSGFDKATGQSKGNRGDIGILNNMTMKIYTTLLLRDWEFELDENQLQNDLNEEVINGMNVSSAFPHFNVYLKMRKKDNY